MLINVTPHRLIHIKIANDPKRKYYDTKSVIGWQSIKSIYLSILLNLKF